MRGRRFSVKPSREWLPVFYVFLFFGFAWYWWSWIPQTTKATRAEGWILTYLAWPLIIFVSAILAVAIWAIFNEFGSKKRIGLNLTYIITYVILNIWYAYDLFGIFFWIN